MASRLAQLWNRGLRELRNVRILAFLGQFILPFVYACTNYFLRVTGFSWPWRPLMISVPRTVSHATERSLLLRGKLSAGDLPIFAFHYSSDYFLPIFLTAYPKWNLSVIFLIYLFSIFIISFFFFRHSMCINLFRMSYSQSCMWSGTPNAQMFPSATSEVTKSYNRLI